MDTLDSPSTTREDSAVTALDTATDTGAPAGDPVAEISARVHDEIGSLVYVSWQQEQAGEAWIEYSVDDGQRRASPVQVVSVGAQEALLLGVPFATTVTFQVVADTGAGPVYSAKATITTDDLPMGLPLLDVLIFDPLKSDSESEWVFMSITEHSGGFAAIFADWWVLIMDREGRIVWARKTPGEATSMHPRISHDGTDLLVDEATFWDGGFDFGAGSQLHRMKIDGTITETYATPGMHHAFTDTAEGAIVWAANEGSNETLQMRTADGESVELWDCRAHLISIGMGGDCGSNAIFWHESSNSFLYSFYSLFTIFEISAAGEVTRTFGQLDTSWSFDPVEANFWWQHGGYYTDAGTLLVSTYVEEAGIDTIVREYTLDEDSETLTEVWNFGIGDGLWGEYMGEPHRLAGGNTLHNLGSLARIREATPEGEVVWDVEWDGGSGSHWIGRSTPVADLYALAP